MSEKPIIYKTDCYNEPYCSFCEVLERLNEKSEECERLEYEVGSLENDRDILQDKCDQLKAENDELKVQNIKYMNGNIGYQLKNSLYKQTLTEIKELLLKTPIDSQEHCVNAKSVILQKISEVNNV